MAKRYSGTIQIIVTLSTEDSTSYSARLVELNDDARFERLDGIKLAPALASRIAADSAEAYDEVARVALSFAGNADEAVHTFGATDDDGGFTVRRRRR